MSALIHRAVDFRQNAAEHARYSLCKIAITKTPLLRFTDCPKLLLIGRQEYAVIVKLFSSIFLKLLQ